MSTAKQARWIKEVTRRQEITRSIHLAIERCRDCNKNQLKILTDRLGIERCRDCLKTVFQDGKNIDMNATQPRIQTSF